MPHSTTPMTTEQLDAARRIMQRDGWEYVEDRFYPVSDPRRKGWWINPQSADPTLSNRRGDSRDYSYATESAYRLYSGHSDVELS